MFRLTIFIMSLVEVLSQSSCQNKFGVQQIYAASPGGMSYDSNFDKSRSFSSVRQDPGDPRCVGRGKADWTIGKGVVTTTGSTPRYYCLINHENIEITLYWKRGSETEYKFYNGMALIGRSRHQNYKENQCDAAGYYLRMFAGGSKYGGQLCVTKEFVHGSTVVYSSHTGCSQVFPKEVPVGRWIGVKFVIQTVSNGVNLRGYVDTESQGAAGAKKWKLKVDFTDTGSNMPATVDSKKSALLKACKYSKTMVVRRSGGVFIFRSDRAKNYQYKMFSAREIVPNKLCSGGGGGGPSGPNPKPPVGPKPTSRKPTRRPTKKPTQKSGRRPAVGAMEQGSGPVDEKPNSVDSSSKSSDNKKVSMWVIVSCVVGGCVLLLCLGLLTRHFFCTKKLEKEVPLAQQGEYNPPDVTQIVV